MRQMWKKRGHGRVDQRGEAATEEGGIAPPHGGNQRDDYIITLLERIAYQLYQGPMEFDEYLDKVVRKNADKLP